MQLARDDSKGLQNIWARRLAAAIEADMTGKKDGQHTLLSKVRQTEPSALRRLNHFGLKFRLQRWILCSENQKENRSID